MQGDDLWQVGYVVDEGCQVVVVVDYVDLDWQFDVELLGNFGKQFDFFEFQVVVQVGMSDVFEQFGYFGVVG